MSRRHMPKRASDAAPRWWLLLIGSLVAHVGLASALTVLSPADGAVRRAAIELTARELPQPRVDEEKPEEPRRPTAQEPPSPPEPAPRVRKRVVAPKAQQQPPTEQPPSEQPPSGPKIFGLPDMESTAKAPAGQSVAVPQGDSLRVDPRVRRRGPPSKGFQRTFQAGQAAPLSVITTRPRPLTKVQPEYPQRLQDLGVEGRVVLELTVDGSGNVVAARVLRGLHPELDQAAVAAARKMRFSPARVNGTPVQTTITHGFVFVLD